MSFTANINEIVAENRNGLLSNHATWCRIALGDVVELLNGFPFDSKMFTRSGGAPLIRIRDILRGSTETYYDGKIPDGYWVNAGEILVGMDGDFNIARWKSGKALLNQRVLKLSAKHEIYNEQFLFWVVGGYLQAINENTPSVTVKHLSSQTVRCIPLPLPPRAEQTRIAAKLEELLAQVDTLKARIDGIPALLKRFRQSVLAAAVSGQLTGKWRGNSSVSDNWRTLKFSSLIKKLRAGSAERPCDHDAGVPIIRSSAVRSMALDYSDVRYLSEGADLRNEDFLHVGDLLFTRLSGSAEFVGVCALVSNALATPTQYPDRVFCARLDDPQFASYLEIFFASDKYLSYIRRSLKSSAGHQRITMDTIRDAEVVVPPLEEQTEIVRRVEQLFAFADQLEARVAAAQERIDKLTQSILAKAFRGELVPQDPNDEPASVLLERIKAQRAAAPKAKRGRKAKA